MGQDIRRIAGHGNAMGAKQVERHVKPVPFGILVEVTQDVGHLQGIAHALGQGVAGLRRHAEDRWKAPTEQATRSQ